MGKEVELDFLSFLDTILSCELSMNEALSMFLTHIEEFDLIDVVWILCFFKLSTVVWSEQIISVNPGDLVSSKGGV